jgi:hypothetical protein
MFLERDALLVFLEEEITSSSKLGGENSKPLAGNVL